LIVLRTPVKGQNQYCELFRTCSQTGSVILRTIYQGYTYTYPYPSVLGSKNWDPPNIAWDLCCRVSTFWLVLVLGLAILNFEGKIIGTRIRSSLKTETKKQPPAGVRPKTRTGTKTCFIQVPILHSLRNVFLMLQMFVYVLFFPTVVRHVVILWKNFKHTFFWIINFRLDGGDGIRNVIIMFGTCFECAILFIILKNKNLKKFWNNINIWLIMLFQKFLRFLTKKIRNENLKYDVMFENISFVEMETSKRIIYLTSMCCNGQGTKFCCFLITTRLGRFFLER
jgi:hypothetical protein